METKNTGADPFLEAMSDQANADNLVKLFQELWNDTEKNIYNVNKWQSTFILMLKVAKS